MPKERTITVDSVRASRTGHNFHERWTARRALQLVFPSDHIYAIAIEGLSTNEEAEPGDAAQEIADLVLYYGTEDSFGSASAVQTLQFKYRVDRTPVTSSYLKKTIEKFADSVLGYQKEETADEVDKKLSFGFVTNCQFATSLWDAIAALKAGTEPPTDGSAKDQFDYLSLWCRDRGVDPHRLFSMTEFRAGEKNLPVQKSLLRRSLTDWSAGNDGRARIRVHELVELVVDKAGVRGARNNLVKRENVLDALGCEPEDLFPADSRFVDVGEVVERSELNDVLSLVKTSAVPVLLHAEGGVGKTVFVQSLAAKLTSDFEVVVFDCFGGGAYRSEDQARHLPSVGFVQIANELASRGLCDPLLPGDADTRGLVTTMRRRLEQAAGAVQEQSEKSGIVVVLDAADNAQLEANNRKDEAFPRLLLASLSREPIDGVKLLLTARPERKDGVIGRASVALFKLGVFSDEEARTFIAGRLPAATEEEVDVALRRSRCNARVLAYLVESWDQNVSGNPSSTPISVEEIVAQRCEKIFADLHVAGWNDGQIKEFFAAISLLPPPIPLDELANALGWPVTQVNSAAADLAPMLELVPQGAIFRDEPTETYVWKTYSQEHSAQQAIAQRLKNSQLTSSYAAEALPRFLVTINDSNRAYELAGSSDFPAPIQSDYGRRRLTLARLQAAFRLAVKQDDLNRALLLTTQLAQVAAANARGDDFIRRAPGLGIKLGDKDVSRRLFNDRSGWRGARNVRLTLAYCFAGEMEEARTHQNRAIRWINWHYQNQHEDRPLDGPRPQDDDFAALMFLSVLRREFDSVDGNLKNWNLRFAISVCNGVIRLALQYEQLGLGPVLDDLCEFAASDECKSYALRIALIGRHTSLAPHHVAAIAKRVERPGDDENDRGVRLDDERVIEAAVSKAAFAALVRSSRSAARHIVKTGATLRASSYDYSERYGFSRIWTPTLSACLRAWSAGQRASFHHLLPRELKIGRKAKALKSNDELREFLSQQTGSRARGRPAGRPKAKEGRKPLFDDNERRAIASGIQLIRSMAEPIETAVLSGQGIGSQCVDGFLNAWSAALRLNVHWRAEEATDVLCRTVGIGFAASVFEHADQITEAQGTALIEIVSGDKFRVQDRLAILNLLAKRPNLHNLTGRFAQKVAESIRRDESIDQRGNNYRELAENLLPMSVAEAREYYRQGLAELDQMGGDDHDIIYALLNFAAVQPGGFVRPELGHRLLNLCQTIIYDASKFGWTLLAKAAANSIGMPAAYKFVRWADQDVAPFSYGLPQFAGFSAAKGLLDPRRAAVIFILCEDIGWYDWKLGDGLADVLGRAAPEQRQGIFAAVWGKVRAEHPFGGWASLWEGFTGLTARFPGVILGEEHKALEERAIEAQKRTDEINRRNNPDSEHIFASRIDDTDEKAEADENIVRLVESCDLTSAVSIDAALAQITREPPLPYHVRQQFFGLLKEKCPYDQRAKLLFALCEVSGLEVDDVIRHVVELMQAWSESSTHLRAEAKAVVERLFAFRGSEIFELRFANISREVNQLTELCQDHGFVMRQLLLTVANEEVDLGGEEWLQVATNLCKDTSPSTGLEALEKLLSSPAARIADEIGEGPFLPEFAPDITEAQHLANLIWHFLGADDAYMRWTAAKCISTLAALGLHDDLKALFDLFDERAVGALETKDQPLPYLNSQQWLLMGFARATARFGDELGSLGPLLVALANRDDLHVIDKLHVERSLRHLNGDGTHDAALAKLHSEIAEPPHGYLAKEGYPEPVEPQSGFSFDYEFSKSEISTLARLFGLSQGEIIDQMAAEIKKRWPAATGMDYFSGHERYRWHRSDRHEFFRKHVQKHALLHAATTFLKTLSVVRRSYEMDGLGPYHDWLGRYDVAFKDGSFLSDHKDTVPECAKAYLLACLKDRQPALEPVDILLNRLGFTGQPGGEIPLYGRWKSVDGVWVRITAGLSPLKGAIGRCQQFSKRPDHEFWIPIFDNDGYDDDYRQVSPFEPLVWDFDPYPRGIDEGDKLATPSAAARPRLGIELTSALGLSPDADLREWRTADGELAIRSQVWGEWQSNEYDHREDENNNGELLLTNPTWLDNVLERQRKRLVLTVSFSKYKSRYDFEEVQQISSAYVLLYDKGGIYRTWHAKRAAG